MRDDTAELSPGQIVGGRYLVLCTAGHGGSAAVYRVRDIRLDKIWALKVIRSSDQGRQSCALELKRMKSFNHPALPRIADAFEIAGGSCIVMDFLEGKTLDRLPNETGPAGIGRDQLIRWGIQICGVLDYLHHCRPPVIYRDLKPGNILLKPDGNVMLLDFGTPGGMGTPGYAAPEQLTKGGHADERSDIYGLGRTLYKLYQFDRGSKEDRRFLRILKKACAPAPEQRFFSALDMKKALEELSANADGFALRRIRKNILLSGISCLALLPLVLTPVVGGENSAASSAPKLNGSEQYDAITHAESAADKKERGKEEAEELSAKAEEYREKAESCAGTNPQQAICFLEEACECLKGISGKEDLLYDSQLRIFRLFLNAEPGIIADPDTEISGYFQKLCTLDPGRREPYLMYISYEYRNGNLAKAADLFREASGIEGIESDPGYQSLKTKLINAGAVP